MILQVEFIKYDFKSIPKSFRNIKYKHNIFESSTDIEQPTPFNKTRKINVYLCFVTDYSILILVIFSYITIYKNNDYYIFSIYQDVLDTLVTLLKAISNIFPALIIGDKISVTKY